MSDLRSWLMLSAVPGIGGQRFQSLLARFGSPENVFQASPGELMSVPGLGEQTARSIRTRRDEAFAEQQLIMAERTGVRIVTWRDDAYPTLLRDIYDPPPVLYMRGMWNPEDRQAIAVVGTRYTSGYGRQTTERLTSALCEQPLTIVSGMARGVDTVAHRTALEKGARTIAALGSGLDKPYPYENRALMEAIAEQGAVVSEQPLGTDPDAMNFPQRNRIISGMSLGVLVIEAGEKSGALITARYALEHNREVFAVPGPLTSETSVGTNRLIKEGTAKLIQNVGDILVELPGSLRLPVPVAPVQEPPPSLSPEERCVYDLLGATPLHIDRIAALLEMTTSRALGLLLALELKEGARQLPGKQFVKG